MVIDYIEVAKIVVPILAIILSIVTIILTKKNIKKQLRLGKLEEILEILYYLSSNYYYFYWLVSENEKLSDGERAEISRSEYDTRVEELFTYVGKENFQDKLSRLSVLTSAYLRNKPKENLQLKIHGFVNLFSVLAYTLAHNDISLKKEDYSDGLPRPKKLIQLINSIQDLIIKEMGLGYKPVSLDEMRKYREGQFKIDLQ